MNARAERAAMLLLPLLTLLSPRPTSAAGAAVPPPGWLHDLWTTQGLFEGDGSKASAASSSSSSSATVGWPANVSFTQIIDAFVPPSKQDRFVVNLGANDGARHDPAFPLIVDRAYGGILVEGDPSFKKRLYANIRPFNTTGRLQISWGFASASSIGPRLLSLGCPRAPDALKIDVEGLDAALLEGILQAGIAPKAIVVEVNPDIPPPLRISQLYHDAFKFEFLRKHMRGWLGASADALYELLGRAGYALVALELGTREHLVCAGKGKAKMCKKKGTCTHCENNMWFVRADLLKAATGLEPPSWSQFVHAYWKQLFAFNTYIDNRAAFTGQTFRQKGEFSRADEERPFTPECYALSELQYYKAQPGESFTKPDCPLVTLKAQAEAAASGSGGKDHGVGWRAWAKRSLVLAKPANAARAAEFCKSTAEAFRVTACKPDEACPYNATATTHRRKEAASELRRLAEVPRRGQKSWKSSWLKEADYPSWVKLPEKLADSPAAFVMNPMAPNHGHVKMATNFSKMLGFKSIDATGITAARKLQAAGAPFVYMTLTNDHQAQTEKGHDLTLAWERSEASRSAAGVFIGPPGKNILEGPRKAQFCEMSEDLAKRTGDQWNRFAPPCVTKSDSTQNGEEYAALLKEAPPVVRAPGYEQVAAPPRWLTRKVATKRVAAAGGFMYPLTHEKALKANMTQFHKHGPMLLRYLDPPLLQTANHLGVPVRTRVEVRVFGMVQWEPLRIWTSRYGFFRGGTPWMNYSGSVEFGKENGAMWNVNRGVEAKCEPSLPTQPPPWGNADSYRKCKGRKATLMERAAQGCCVCQTVADVIDMEHDEKGFATSGTLRRLDHVISAAGLDVRRVWQNVDEALIKQFIAEQRRFQAEAKGAPLSRWATLFSADVGFAADGRAYLYENLLQPNWKRPGYFWHEAVDRAGAIGIYSGQMLAMAPMLMEPEADAFHAKLLAPLGLEPQAEKEAKEFLRSQGLAKFLGFRRTWPSPTRARAHAFDTVADARDVAFARLLNEHQLLLPGMDVLSTDPPSADAWGGVAANPAARGPTRWKSDRTLYDFPNGYGRNLVCDDTKRILESWSAQAHARGEANGFKNTGKGSEYSNGHSRNYNL